MRALVLCAGLGTRLGPLTAETPKALLPIAGEPLLARALRLLAMHGYDQVAINLHHRGEQIRACFGARSRFGQELRYLEEPQLQGTAGTFARLAAEIALGDDEPLLVLYGDLLLDQDLGALRAFHHQRRAAATLLVHRRSGSNSVVMLDEEQRISGFVERPGSDQAERLAAGDVWVNSGVQLLTGRVARLVPPGRPADLPADVYARIFRAEALYGFPLAGYRCAIDSPERYREAQQALAEGRCRS